MAIYVRRYDNCTPAIDSVTGDVVAYTGSAIAVTNDTLGILKATITDPNDQLRPLLKNIVEIAPGATANVAASLTDLTDTAVTTQSIVVIMVEGATNPEAFVGATAAIAYA